MHAVFGLDERGFACRAGGGCGLTFMFALVRRWTVHLLQPYIPLPCSTCQFVTRRLKCAGVYHL